MAYEREGQTDTGLLKVLAASLTRSNTPLGYDREAQTDLMELQRQAGAIVDPHTDGGYERSGHTNIAGLRRKIQSGGGGPFDPSTIAGLKLWLKADSLALSDGNTVFSWADSSGNGNDFGNVGSLRPIFKTNIVNGKPVVRFDGATQAIVNSSASIISANYTIFVVASAASISGASHDLFSSGVVGGSNRSAMLRRDTDTLNHFHFDTGYVSAGETSAIVAGAWNVITADWNGSNIHLWRNGTLKATTGTTLIGNTGINNSIGVDQGSGMDYWDGDIAEVLIYNSALSTTDRQNVEGYLRTKYGTP